MPFTKDDFVLCLDARSQDKTTGRFQDETPYSVGGNQARNTTANVVLIAKMDAKENLNYTVVVPDSIDPLVSMKYSFTTIINVGGKYKDGAYRAFLFVHSLWANDVDYQEEITVDGSITQYGDIIYHVASETFYKVLQPSGPETTVVEPSVDNGWEDYWEVYTGDRKNEILNDRLIVHIHDDIVPFNFEDCFKDELLEIGDEIIFGNCNSWEELVKPVKMALVLDTANSNNWQDKQTKAEVILQEGNKKFCC